MRNYKKNLILTYFFPKNIFKEIKTSRKKSIHHLDGDHVLVTIITDGEENSSEEWTLKMIRTMIEKLKKQNWTFTLIGTDNLDVETMAHSFAIDEHLEFQQDEAGTKAMFARERRSRERYNCCVAEDAAMPIGSFFKEEEN